MLILDESRAPLLQERWERAERLGARADGEAYPTGTSGSDLALRRERLCDVFREERALIEPITEQLAARGLVALVADPDGVILAAHGGGEFLTPAARVRLVEGACWSEQARGTNAIGTAIAERRSVAVVGAAHFEERNRGLFCYAAPIHDAYGDLAAVLDVTGALTLHDPAVGVAVHAAGAALERALRGLAFAGTGAGALPAIERLVHRCAAPSLLVEASGEVRIANTAALAAFPAGGRLSCERLFGLPFSQLAELARAGTAGPRSVRFETRSAAYDVELEPILGARGRALAVLVHMDTVRARTTHSHASRVTALPAAHPAFDAILAADPGVVRAKVAAARFAGTVLPVLLLAETGTGKELFARAVHDASARAQGPFVPLNCGALAPALLESELFGYAPGAFTGASRTGAEGRLGAANGGTLFLDEIAEMPDALQAALLRVLDDGVYHRVGEAKPRRADFRLVCATCRDLPALVEAGTFRRDLFYRIHGALVTIPPLRERGDRVWLAERLLERIPDAPPLSDEARAWVSEHDWPGNVRELKSAMTHAAALAEGRLILREDFPAILLGRTRHAGARTRDELMLDAVHEAVRQCNGNLSEAARRLGVARSTVYRAIKR